MKEELPDNLQKILVVVLCGYERHQWISPTLMDFLNSLKYNQNYITFCSKAYNFIPAAAARNFIGEQSRLGEPKPDWILMIDNDMGPPENLLDSIKDAPADAAVVVPRFHMWDGDRSITRLCWGMTDEKVAEVSDENGIQVGKQYYELNKCGTGAIFIRPYVFERLDPPWFEYKYSNDKIGHMEGTEDIVFAEKVLAAGMKIYGWGGCEVAHYHTVDVAALNVIVQKVLLQKFQKSENSEKLVNA